MAPITRRTFIECAAATAAVGAAWSLPAAAKETKLHSLTQSAKAIAPAERSARLQKVQGLMQQRNIGALLVEAGPNLEYFTGVRWWRSERTTAALIPAEGAVIIVTPFFEEPSIRETLQVPGSVRAWQEDQSPFDLLADAIREQRATTPIAVEATTRFFIVERTRKAVGSSRDFVAADDLVRACREIKSPAELALLQVANQVTLEAIRHAHSQMAAGMTADDVLKAVIGATTAFGGTHEFTLVLLNEASAFPHGSVQPQLVRTGSVILIDSGCSVHGYASDISRTWIHGEPTPKQREVWKTVKEGQQLALETAKPGVPVGAIDRAVRDFYESKGWSKNYGLPGTPHRTGHGIGMEGHESPYLVRSDQTPLAAGMCFSDEPGIYIPGEFGIRLEDCWYMTDSAPKLFTPLAKSIDQPV